MAKEVPLVTEIEIPIPVGQFSVVDFPFEIKGLHTTSFMPAKQGASVGGSIPRGLPKASDASLSVGAFREALPSANQIEINRGVNTLTFFPRERGRVELVVWGYDFPVMVSLLVAEEGGKYYSFVDPKAKEHQAASFESSPHVKVISALVKSLYNNTVPVGYEIRETAGTKIPMTNFEVSSGRILLGQKYQAEEWYVTNTGKKPVRLDSTMFYAKGIYSVTIENDILAAGEGTRIFLTKASEGGK